METRILIPVQLSVVVKDKVGVPLSPNKKQKCSNSNNSSPSSNPEEEDEVQEPTSSNLSDVGVSEAETELDVELTEKDSESDEEEEEEESDIGSSRGKKRKNFADGETSNWKVVAKTRLLKGTTFLANEGELQTIFLDQLPILKGHDIRLLFGCVDREGETDVRVCNWLRFLRLVEKVGESNLIGSFVDGVANFELTKDVGAGEELVVNFDITRLHKDVTTTKEDGQQKSRIRSSEGPLDLSTSLSPYQKFLPLLPPPTIDRPAKPQSHHYFSISSVLQLDKETGKKGDDHAHTGHGMRTRQSQPHPQTNFFPVRPILRTRGRERSLLPCEVCGKAFDRPSLLKRHMRTHTGEKPHVCDVCGKGFSTSSSLNTHRRIHSGEKPHQCGVCGKRFTASSNLYYHRMTHNKEKPHKCVCGKSFPTPGDLKSHQYVHSGSWPFQCAICHRGFSKQTNLRNHLLLHSGDRPHNCHICHKRFALACNLRAHLRTHEEESASAHALSSCLRCKRSFLSSLNMLVNGHCRSCLLDKEEAKGSGKHSARKYSTPLESEDSTSSELSPRRATPVTPNATTVSATSNKLGAYGGLPFPFSAGQGSSSTPFLEQLFQWNYRFAKETAGNLNLMQQKLMESQMLAAQLMIGSSPPSATATSTTPTAPQGGGGVAVGLPSTLGFSVSDLLRASAAAALARSSQSQPQPHPLSPFVPFVGTGEFFPNLDLNKFMQQ